MKRTNIVLKDGTKLCGNLWRRAPLQGELDFCDDTWTFSKTLRYADIELAVTKDVQTHYGVVEDVDELALARERGWDGR